MKKLTTALALFTLSGFAFANTITGIVGDSTYPVLDVPETPEAVVFDDKLLVFYQWDQYAAFSVASADAEGKLVWEKATSTSYTRLINTLRLASDSFSPVPVTLGDRLYLFGNDGNKIVYNAVDSLEHLKDNAWVSQSPDSLFHGTTAVELEPNSGFSVLEYSYGDLDTPDEARKLKILMAYYKPGDKTFSYSDCLDVEGSMKLTCAGSKVVFGQATGLQHKGAPHLMNAIQYDNRPKYLNPVVYIRDEKDKLRMYSYHPQHGYGEVYQWWYDYTPIPNDVKASNKPIGTAEVFVDYPASPSFYQTHLYYKGTNGEDIFKVTGVTGYSDEEYWDTPVKIGAKTTGDQGVETVVFNGRAYVFYVDKATRELRYYSDTVAQAPILH